MAPTTQYLAALVLAFASFTTAMPIEEIAYPEVVPGPGLPSLAELGLTSKQLHTMPIDRAALAIRAAQFDPVCGPVDYAYTNVGGIIACYNYLNSLGTQQCSTPSGAGISQFCYSGDGNVIGQSIGGPSSSYCRDVAFAVLYTVDHCTRPDQSVAGFQAAYGNGDLIVGSVSSRYAS